MNLEFQRVAIVNRGEPALRFLNAVKEWNLSESSPLTSIALFTEVERHSLFVRRADESHCLGPALFTSADGSRKSAYLSHERLQDALLRTRAEAVWPGWGFVAEDASFADLCERLGIVFIGPGGPVMRALGDKISSKRLAEAAGVPITPWSGGPVESLEDARAASFRIGFPLVIKATAGGGGRGIRRVEAPEELAEAFERSRSEAEKAFGDPTVFMEKMLTGVRHIEVQIIGDRHGNVWAPGVRDCTVQRRNQKVLEEAPSPALSPGEDQFIREASKRLARAAGYQNAGTVEYLYDPRTGAFSFMEVNARLQVEHPVTEMTTGLDMVKLQLFVARGGRLDGDPPEARGHAIEARLNAEDPDNGFAPAPGRADVLRLPGGPGVRVDAGVVEGDGVPPEFDSMIAKVLAHGRNREEARARLARALRETHAVLRGGTTNRAFLLELLCHPDFKNSQVDVRWLDRLTSDQGPRSRELGEIALLRAAIDAYEEESFNERISYLVSASRGRPHVAEETGSKVELKMGGTNHTLFVYRLGPDSYRINVEGLAIDVRVDRMGGTSFEMARSHDAEWRLTVAGHQYRVNSVAQGTVRLVEADGLLHRVSRDDGGAVRAPSPAVVVSIGVKDGDLVAAGDRLLVIEAMKMEMPVLAPFSGRVREVFVRNNMQVSAGTPLLRIEASSAKEDPQTGEGLHFEKLVSSLPRTQGEQIPAAIEKLMCLLLGWDISQKEAKALAQECEALAAAVTPSELSASVIQACEDVLGVFLDVVSLFRRQPAEDDGEAAPSSEEWLFTYLRNQELGNRRLPAVFLDRLLRAAAHYGVLDLERSPRTDEALFRLGRARLRENEMLRPVIGLLEMRARCGVSSASFRQLLSRFVSETQRRFPQLNELSRDIRFRLFERPLFEETRNGLFREAMAHVASLALEEERVRSHQQMAALVDCPHPLAGLFASHWEQASRDEQAVMMEALTRRYYRLRELRDLERITLGTRNAVTAAYLLGRIKIRVIATAAPIGEFREVIGDMDAFLRTLPPTEEVVIDFLAKEKGLLEPEDQSRSNLEALLETVRFTRSPRRLVVSLSGTLPDGGTGTHHFTYRPSGSGFAEDAFYRGAHPMIAKRLRINRLAHFAIERIPSAEDIYLLHARARQNSRDERLIAVAEVRDLTPIKDESGKAVQLPYLEHMLLEALASIRRFQAQRPLEKRLFWNRVVLYIWPPFLLTREELGGIVRRLAPATEGLGLELVMLRMRMPRPPKGELQDTVLTLSNPAGQGVSMTFEEPTEEPIPILSEYEQKAVRLRQRGLADPYQLARMVSCVSRDAIPGVRPGDFTEYDLGPDGRLIPVDRPAGRNVASVVVGIVRTFTLRYPEGMTRLLLIGDPSRDLGALAEPECRRIVAGIALARQMKVPIDWFALSAGAKISMESGTENMDWIALVLRHLVRFTQDGGEVNIVVNGINVGAQPYWNAEATMLMHTRGILVMMPESAMVLTGKKALDYSGGVSAEDNQGIGGYERIMGPNGQAQYFARDLAEACHVLTRHHEHTWVAPGERFPRRAETSDPIGRDICLEPYAKAGDGFATIGDVFSEAKNPGRKKPFDIRRVLASVIDQDHPPLERWASWHDAETAIVWDARIGGYSVCLLGMESRPLPRLGFLPADGPDQWTAGTLFPQSSRKVARALNAASGNRPAVFLANLSGFDGSPESLRQWQLEYGAEIGRAVVNFRGPIVFCVISRYHGGAFVVFSNALNDEMQVAALEGAHASVIGGAPAAAVVFARDVDQRTRMDQRVVELEKAVAFASGREKGLLAAQLAETFSEVHAAKLGQVAEEFDRVHSVGRAREVGSIEEILPPSELRPWLVAAVEKGVRRVEEADGRRPSAEPLALRGKRPR